MTDKHAKIVITGAAGLVGQNLIVELKQQGYTQLVAIDKHAHNLDILHGLHPDVRVVKADLAEPGAWAGEFNGAACVVQLHAQITGKTTDLFVRNNITATGHVLKATQDAAVPYMVHISSSVVNSVAKDDYTNTEPDGEVFDIVGDTRVDYVDIIRTIKRVKKLHTVIVHIPIGFFGFLLKVYSLFSSKPPFTADQLKALSAGDDFKGIDTEAIFGVRQTPFEEAIRESYTDPRYSHIVLQR